MKLLQLETPALIVNKNMLEHNMAVLDRLLEGTVLRLRPHYKSHKCAAIAHMQIAGGAVGITCAKLSEAEDLADSGIEDILIANQITDPARILKAALLAGKCRLTLCVDEAENARELSAAAQAAGSVIHCYVEYDIGMQRCGVTGEDAFIELAALIDSLPGLAFDGIQAYAGNAAHVIGSEDRRALTEANEEKIRRLKERLASFGLKVKAVSGGSTGTAALKAAGGVYTELQAGSYLFLDSTYGELESLPFEHSLYVLTTVVSSRPGLAVLDAGAKSLGMDQNLPLVLGLDLQPVGGEVQVNEEHLKLFAPSIKLSPGDKLLLIPGHCCSTVNLYDRMYVYSGDRVLDRLTVSARGCSR